MSEFLLDNGLVAAAGLAAGHVLHQISLNGVESKRQALLSSHNDIDTQRFPLGGKWRLASEHAGTVAIAAVALFNGLSPHGSAPVSESGPVVGVVNQDFNYELTNSDQGTTLSTLDPSAKLEDEVADNLLSNVSNFHLSAVYSGRAASVNSAQQLAEDAPYGTSQFIQTEVSNDLTTSFTSAPKEKSNLLSGTKVTSVSGAELIIDDGASLGNPAGIVAEAKQAGNIPVYIANVSGNSGSAANTAGLQMIASETDGHYWSIDKSDASKVADQIEADVHVQGSPNRSGNPDAPIWLAVAAVAATIEARLLMKQLNDTAIS